MLRWPLQRKLLAAFVAILVLVAALAAVRFSAFRRQAELRTHVNRAFAVIAQVQTIGSLLTEERLALRATLQPVPDSMARFLSARAAITGQLDRLRQLSVAQPFLRPDLARLDPALDSLEAFEDRVTALAAREGAGAARAMVSSGTATTRMADVREALARLVEQEEEQLGLEEADLAATQTNLLRTEILFDVLIAAILLGAYGALRRSQTKRAQAQSELDSFFDLGIDLFCIAGTDTYFKKVNPAFTQVLGYTRDELLARPFLDFVHPDDRAATVQEVDNLSAGRPVLHFENRYRHQDGSWRWLSWRSVPQPNGVIYATARDVTHQKAEERELAERTAALEAVNQELEAFSYSVSHDLRAPLRHIQGYVQMLIEDTEGQLSPEAQRHVQVVAGASREMGALIDDLLAYSRMGRVELRRTTVELDGLVRETLERLKGETENRNILWSIAPLPAVHGDRTLLGQALLNLLDNAVKYSRPRDPARIEVSQAGREGDRVILLVRDNGVGFDLKYADKVFGVFQRLHRADEFEGTGIGLATVHRIITRHGGRVWVEAAPDQGATFYFTLLPADRSS